MKGLFGILAMSVMLTIFAGGCSAAAGPTPMPTATPDIGAMVQAAIVSALGGTATPVETPTVAPTPRPTQPRSSTEPATVLPTSTPASAKDLQFSAQLTRLAPTLTIPIPRAIQLVNKTGIHYQWHLMTIPATAAQRMDNGYAGGQTVNDKRGQQYTCAIYEDGLQVPRINLAFSRDLTYRVVINQAGEHQGSVNAVTTVAGEIIPVEWRTWTSRTDRIRLRGADAVRLLRGIADQRADAFRLELRDDPDMSRTYDVTNLLAAIMTNEMSCFEE